MLTAVVLTKNESFIVSRCLASLKFADRLLVIDDNSTDDTVAIAKKYKARVLPHPIKGDFSAARNFALSRIRSGWVLFIDADEVVSAPLAAEITAAVQTSAHSAYFLTRQDILWGKTLLYGDTGRHRIIRLGWSGSGKFTGAVHETWHISGSVGLLRSPLYHYPHPDLASFLRHLNLYSTLRANELFTSHHPARLWPIILFPPGKFFHLYLLKFGFLDGVVGLIHALVMSFYTFLVRGKLYLLSRGIS